MTQASPFLCNPATARALTVERVGPKMRMKVVGTCLATMTSTKSSLPAELPASGGLFTSIVAFASV
ncbi:hypothetical protein D3C83_270630 [compost metagenome]